MQIASLKDAVGMRKFTFWILPQLTTPTATAALAGPDAIAIGVINDLSGCPEITAGR